MASTVKSNTRQLPTVTGDIWEVSTKNDTIVIPTNVGWKTRDGKNPMGKGLAAQAARRFRFLPKLYGDFCRRHKAATPLLPVRVPRWCHLLLFVPTKELDRQKPYLSWRAASSQDALTVRLQQLQVFAQTFTLLGEEALYYTGWRRILVPALGCGEGGLTQTHVATLLAMYLTHPAFVFVRKGETHD